MLEPQFNFWYTCNFLGFHSVADKVFNLIESYTMLPQNVATHYIIPEEQKPSDVPFKQCSVWNHYCQL